MENIENEIWKDVVGYEGIYKVSNFGKVLSISYRNKEYSKIRLNQIDNYGYSVIDLFLCKKRRNVKVHRLVAIAFIPNPENKPQVNHKDGNKLNNHVFNLEWCTDSENNIHAYKIGLKFMSCDLKIKIAKIKSKKIINNKTGIIYDSLTDACKKEKISQSYLWKILKGKVIGRVDLSYYYY